MKLIKDLGMQYPNDDSAQRKRFGLYECDKCKTHIRCDSYIVKRQNQRWCRSCSNRKDRDD